jgi:DNA-binding transcriptional LysR family regulator
MLELIKSIDSLSHLAAFEASARHCSFTKAAQELGVSQPAISQSIRRLEQAIGTRLFYRRHRIISLTDAGVMLNHDVSQGLGRILTTVKYLQQQGRKTHVTLSVSTAFAHYWMVPRLQDFHKLHPDVDLRLQTTDKDLDLAQEGISLGVWRGSGIWPGYHSQLIAKESLMAIASPKWLFENGPVDSLAALKARPLINLEEPYRRRPTWAEFFRAFGQGYRDTGQGLRLNDYALVLQTAMAGEGVALGWQHVLGHLMQKRLLCRVGDWVWNSGVGFYLVWSKRAALSDDANTVRSWIFDQCNQAKAMPF